MTTITHTYVINLERRPDKKKHMEQQFELTRGLNPHFFVAVDGTNPDDLSKYDFKIPNWYDPSTGKSMTNGEIGCALSHYAVWKQIVDNVEAGIYPDNCKVLILEDDVVFLDDFQKKLLEYTSALELNYDMLYVHRKPLNLAAEKKLSPHINAIQKSYWACAYILTYAGAKKLINSNYLHNLIPVDEFLPAMYGCQIFGYERLYESSEKIKCYAVNPNLLTLTNDAFGESETYHSAPFLTYQPFKFDDNKEFLLIYIGPTSCANYQTVNNDHHRGDSYKRFRPIANCMAFRIYG